MTTHSAHALDSSAMDMIVTGRTHPADEIVFIELQSATGASLPRWQPGAHIDLLLPDGESRQYSLCGIPGSETWRIGVLREPGGRGGSAWVHDSLVVGASIRVAGPRNHFEFIPERGTRYLFIAGGIGITPLSTMVASAAAVGVDYRLEYAGRSRSTICSP